MVSRPAFAHLEYIHEIPATSQQSSGISVWYLYPPRLEHMGMNKSLLFFIAIPPKKHIYHSWNLFFDVYPVWGKHFLLLSRKAYHLKGSHYLPNGSPRPLISWLTVPNQNVISRVYIISSFPSGLPYKWIFSLFEPLGQISRSWKIQQLFLAPGHCSSLPKVVFHQSC